MSIYPHHRFNFHQVKVPLSLAALVGLAGFFTLYCWYAGFVVATPLAPFLSMMEPNTAAGLVLAAIALALQIATTRADKVVVRRTAEIVAHLLAMVVMALGALTLVQDYYHIDFGIDQFLLTLPAVGDVLHVGRMSPLVASCMVIAGTGLLLMDYVTEKGHHPSEYSALLMSVLMGIPMVGYLYSVASLTKLSQISNIPPQTPILFFMLAIGILAARPTHKLTALLTGASPGGHLMRRLLPLSLVLLIGLDLLVDAGITYRYYSAEQASPIFVLLSSSLLFMLFCWAAVLLNREFTVRRRGEAALSDRNALLNAVSNNTQDGIFVKDPDGRMVFANPAMLALIGKSRDDIIGKTSMEILDDNSAADVDADDRSVLSGSGARVFEHTHVFGSQTRTMYTTKAPWIDENGKTLGLVGITTDITERKRTEDALKAHETRLEALVAARTSEVTELIGHLEATREEEKRAIARELHDDLGSSLTALSMHLAILFQKMPAEPAMTERAVQIKALLGSIADSTRRIQNGLRPDKLDIFGIKVAISDQALEFEKYTGVLCSVSLPDESLEYDSHLNIALFRMVQEALNNIAKHAKATKVNIVLDDNEDEVTLTMRDDGVGIPEGQERNTTTHGLRGMRERAGYLGGTVRIVSGPFVGTTITVVFPKAVTSEDNDMSSEEDRSSAPLDADQSTLPHSTNA